MRSLILGAGIALLLLINTNTACAQDILFNKYYCIGCRGDTPESIICIGDSILVIGTNSFSFNFENIYLGYGILILDVNGEELSSSFIEDYPLGYYHEWHCLTKFEDGDFVIAGRKQEQEGFDCMIARYHPDGTEVWHSYLGHTDIIDVTRAIAIHPDGGIMLVVHTKYNGEDYDIMLVKLNGDGVEEWRQYYGWPGNDDARSITILPDTTMVIGGGGMELDDDPEEGIQDGMLLHVDQYGEPLDTVIFGGDTITGYPSFYRINDHLLLVNAQNLPNNGLFSNVVSFVNMINSNSLTLWSKEYIDTMPIAIWDLEVTELNDILICGLDYNVPSEITDYTQTEKTKTGFVTKLDSMGNEQWYRQYVFTDALGMESDQLHDLTTDSQGNIYAVGYALVDHPDGSDGMDYSIALLKLGPDGCIEPGCTDTVLYLNGETTYTIGSDTITAIQQQFIHQSYFTISPNPISQGGQAVMRLYNELNSDAELRIYDASASILKSYKLPQGAKEMSLDGIQGLGAGIYFAALVRANGVIVETRKIVLMGH
jgi:hypothetical protein